LADYFLFAFRFFFFAAFFFDVLRAVFFAAILRTVVAFFLLFGIETTPSKVSEGATRVPQKQQEYERVRLTKQ
jgi:hypothetical protein